MTSSKMLNCLIVKSLKCKGFSLLEVIVAITVITIGLIGVIGLITYNLSISRYSPNEVIAINLAEEGLNIVKNIRDTNYLQGNDFDDNIIDSDGPEYFIPIFIDTNSDGKFYDENPSSGYELIKGDTMPSSINANLYQVYYDPNDRFYAQTLPDYCTPSDGCDWIKTSNPAIHRQISIAKIEDGTYCLKVESEVQWKDRTGTHDIVLEEYLYDWRIVTPLGPDPVPATCEDSDYDSVSLGHDYYEFGEVTKGTDGPYGDSCYSESTLLEYFCDNNNISHEDHLCGLDEECIMGACQQK